jgi:hypothetical protein
MRKTAFQLPKVRIKTLGLVYLLLVSVSAHAVSLGGAARPFPDTRSAIRVFADQLPSQLTDAQWRFAATHYAGSQKATRSWVNRIRRLNPRYLMLHYQLAVGTGPAAFVVGDQWTNDFASVTQHESWFLHNEKGQRLHQGTWDWYVMDIRFENGKPKSGYPNYWLKTAIQRMRENEDDGCFADSYTQDILMSQLNPPFDWFMSAESNWKNWLPHLNQFGAYCANGFHRQPERFYYLPNLGGLVTTWDRYTNYAVGDGGMNEGFCAGGPGNYYSDDDWKLQMSRLLMLASKGKILICQTGTDPQNYDHRWFIVGSYLLTKGRRSYLNMFQKSSLEWYPEYDLDLGRYLDDPKADVMRFWNPEWKVFQRDYRKGLVLVNPYSQEVRIPDLGKIYHLVSAQGGGAVPENGKPDGRLSKRPVTSLTIPGHSARVLLNSM